MSDVIIIQVRRGRDGRDYPVPMPPPKAWRWQVITLLHQLVHEQGMSERQAQAELLARGYRRSAGSVHYDLSRLMPGCPGCAEPPSG